MQPSIERPLSGTAKAALLAGTGATILVFYLFALSSVVLLLAFVGVELLLVLALARFGLASFMAGVLGRHLELLPIFVRCVRLGKGMEFRIPLRQADAPGLFKLLEKLSQRMAVAVPLEVSLEMQVNAWVLLKGYRRGAGKTILGIGYDLLAGLSEQEVEAVLAHEMAHAKLVQRGFKTWLTGGVSRAIKLTRSLAVHVENCRRANQPRRLAQIFLAGADTLTRLGTRLVATYSRQEEFAADHGAAELCGPEAICSALLKLEGLNALSVRLPFRERIAQLQSGKGFSQWLVKELAAGPRPQAPGRASEIFNEYSTHPLLRDRLAALSGAAPVGSKDPPPQASAIGLLAKPNDIAEKLILEIQRNLAAQEQKDSKQLKRWRRKIHSGASLRPLQLFAVSITVVLISLGLASGLDTLGVLLILGGIGLGIFLYRGLGRYRERLELTLPDFATFKTGSQANTSCSPEQLEKIECSLRAQVYDEKKFRKRAFLLASAAYTALSRCDYPKAFVAAHLALQSDSHSVEGSLAMAIAAAALGNTQKMVLALGFLQKATGLRGSSVSLGAAWALLLSGEWAQAEAFLEQEPRFGYNNWHLLLALCQSRRGKLQSAILNAREACSPQPRHKEDAKLLLQLLLDGGYLREAEEVLDKLNYDLPHDPELMFAMVRLNLMRQNSDEAEHWVRLLQQAAPFGQTLVELGQVFEAARHNEKAAGFYQQALQKGFYPAACLGLGRLAATGPYKDKEPARKYCLAALNLARPLGERAVAPVALFQMIIGQLLLLQEPVLNCRAWIVRLDASVNPKALANVSFIIFERSLPDAQRAIQSILEAVQPNAPPLTATAMTWREAPREQQPDGPVRPGVQGVYA